jgi:peptidoglycan/xylan/chitin deacetylase (PgdA/CDA1 family)
MRAAQYRWALAALGAEDRDMGLGDRIQDVAGVVDGGEQGVPRLGRRGVLLGAGLVMLSGTELWTASVGSSKPAAAKGTKGTPSAHPVSGSPSAHPTTGSAHPMAGSPSLPPAAGPVAAPPPRLECVPAAALPAGEPQYYVDGGPKTIALTIDDGPDPRYTPELLKILAKYGVSATFCMVGENAVAHPGVVREVIGHGHQVANHTWSHPDDLGRLSPEDLRQEIEQGGRAIEDACGRLPVFFRAPAGTFTAEALTICGRLGLAPLHWSVDPRDWANPGTEQIVDTVVRNTRSGSIILNHDGGGDRSQTVAALRTYLPRLIDAGYRFTPLRPQPRRPEPRALCR